MTSDERRALDTAAMHWAFLKAYHEDHANAAIHTAPVRYSPITFRLAEALRTDERQLDLAEQSHSCNELARVWLDIGAYEEDRGR